MYKRFGVAVVTVMSLSSLLLGAGNASAVTATAASDTSRLSKNVVPTNYELVIEPQINQGTFSGSEKVKIHVLAKQQDIVLNSVGLNIKNAFILRKSTEFEQHRKHIVSKRVPVKIEMMPQSERVRFICGESLSPGSYELDLEFTGKFDDKLRGFFLANYKDDKGNKHSVACTQMEPTDARRMFPCFDEPKFKATYSISAIIDKKLTAISNSPVAHEEDLSKSTELDKKTVTFKLTPKISSYLVALVIGDFASTAVKTEDGVDIRVWAIKGKEAMGNFALETAAKLLPYMNKYFGVKYPSKKLDLIAIPDFGPGAMENLGAITFKESVLLVDETTTSTNGKQIVAEVIAHEMAHQWFGDLVTTRWWDDIWLNEAFASWFGTKAVDYLRPDWRLWDGFGRHALWTDSLKSTRPIHANVKSPEQAMEMFDDITYVKGSAVLRMLERYVGQDVFQRGVQLYMKTHAFKTATTEDLWWAVATTSSKPIPEMMRSWIYQPGYPLISVASVNAGLHLTQQRYFLDPPAKLTTTKWMVPVAFKWLDKEVKTSIEMFDQTERTIVCPAGVAPVFVNADAVGFYRVSYSKEQLDKVEQSLYTDLTPNERYCLLTDMASLVASFNQPVSEELRLTKLCKGEEDPFVVPQIASRVAQWRKFVLPAVRPAYQQYIQYMLLPQKDRLGWQAKLGESDLVQQARSRVLAVLGTYGQHQPTIAEARALFAKYRSDRTSIEPNVVNVVLNIVSYNGSAAEYEQIKQLWQTAKTPESEETDLMMLTNFQKPELIQKTLALSLSNQIQTQDRPRMWSSLLANDSAKRMVWSFIKLHWPEIVKKCPPMALDRVAASCRSLDTAVDEKDLRLFFATHKTAGMESEVSRMLESVHLAVRFREKNGAYINSYMREKQWQK